MDIHELARMEDTGRGHVTAIRCEDVVPYASPIEIPVDAETLLPEPRAKRATAQPAA
jgi:hypothetical protein